MKEYFVKINTLENIHYKSILTIYYEIMKMVFTHSKKQFHVYEETCLTKRKEKSPKVDI